MPSERRDFIRRRTSIPFRKERTLQDRILAERDVTAHMMGMGEPSPAIYPPLDNVIYLAKSTLTRNQRRERRREVVLGLRGVLSDLVEEQVTDNISLNNRITGSNSVEIFASYMQSQQYQDVSKEAAEEIRKGNDTNLGGNLIGKMFEDICFGLRASANTGSSVLLSPQRSYALTKALFPDGHFVEQPFGQNYIVDMGKAYVPDGYLVDTTGEPVIESVFEYTIDLTKRSLPTQFTRFIKAKKRFSEIFSPDCPFVLVIPKGSWLTELDHGRGAKIEQIPITKRDFAIKLDGILKGE